MEDKRIFEVPTAPIPLTHESITEIPLMHDGAHLELFYNLIFSDIGLVLPNHLRPVVMALGDSNIKSLMVIIAPGLGKSQCLSIAYPLWELGYDPNLTILGVSSGAELMMGFLQSSMSIIDENYFYRLMFPNTRPDKDRGWSTGRGAFVKRSGAGIPDPSYAATGYGSKSITGKHAKLLIIDDIQDEENSATSEQIEKVETFYYRTLLGRRDPQGARIVMVGRRWASDDLYGRLKESKDWVVMTLAAIRPTPQLYYDVRIPAGLACVFNNFTPSATVEDIKVVYGENHNPVGYCWNDPKMLSKYEEAALNQKNMPSIFETVYQSNPEAAGTKIFREEDFADFTIPEDMQIGRSYSTVADFLYEKQFDLIVQSWDTAFTADTDNDPSVGYTVGLKGCGKNHKSTEPNAEEVPFHYDIYVLDENYKRLAMGDLQPAVVEYFHLWNPNFVLVENSMPGIPIIHSLESNSIPVLGIVVQHTSKRGRAINGAKAGSAQGWARQGRIFIPHNAPWAAGLIGELKDFTGARNKKDDRVDALIQAANFAIDYGVQNRELPPGWRTDKEIDARMHNWMVPEHPLARLTYMAQNVQNPLYGLCGSCKNYVKENSYCSLHKRTVIKLSTCYLYEPDK
ncbi:MAG TPA: hypothetical protein VKR58_10335, partial [Aquella sp.]|nr:hypothetical protein [Aquella sp.]